MQHLEAMGRRYGFRVNVPINKLRKEEVTALLYGSNPNSAVRRPKPTRFHHWNSYDQWEGILPQLERRYIETDSEYMKEWYSRYMSNQKCPSCNGERFKPEILAVTVNEKSISDASRLSVRQAIQFFSNLDLSEKETIIAAQILKEIRARLNFLMNVGLDYLTLDRAAASLSGGEAQRIQLRLR